MTNTESKFRNWFRKLNPKAHILKFPDFKVGNKSANGYPDYLIINDGVHVWWEVKKVSGFTLSNNDFTEAQLMRFRQLLSVGACIMVCVYDKLLNRHVLRLNEFPLKNSIKLSIQKNLIKM